MTTKEMNSLKKALKKDIYSAECYILLADMGMNLGANEYPEQCTDARGAVVSSLVALKQSISANVEKLLAEIDVVISKMS